MDDQYAAWILAEGFDKPIRKRGSKLRPRKTITLTEKVAAMLCLMPPRANGSPLIPAKIRAKGAKAIAAYPLHWDHIIARGLCGTDSFDNYRPLAPADHKPKTKADKKSMAHSDRVAKAQAEFRERLLRRDNVKRAKSASWPMPGSRSSKWRKRMDGKVELR